MGLLTTYQLATWRKGEQFGKGGKKRGEGRIEGERGREDRRERGGGRREERGGE